MTDSNLQNKSYSGVKVAIDRYGFPIEDLAQMNEEEHRARLRKENSRLVKWQKMLYSNKQGEMYTLSSLNILEAQINHWNTVKRHSKLKSRIRKGIPQSLRGTIWQNLSGARERQYAEYKKYGSIHLYRDLIADEDSPYHIQIWKDIHRTYRKQARFGLIGLAKHSLPNSGDVTHSESRSGHDITTTATTATTATGTIGFTNTTITNDEIKHNNEVIIEQKEEKKERLSFLHRDMIQDIDVISSHTDLEKHATEAQKQLYNVLKAFAAYRKDIGYCQGMQSIAALMLMYLTEEEAFWVLVSLADDPKYSMDTLWRLSMPGISLRFYQVQQLVERTMPALSKHLGEYGLQDPATYQATQWFVTGFLNTSMSFDCLTRIWDIYLNEGVKSIFRFGLGLLKYYEKTLLQSNDMEEIMQIFQNGPSQLHVDRYIDLCLHTIKITHSQLDSLERHHQRLKNNTSKKKT